MGKVLAILGTIAAAILGIAGLSLLLSLPVMWTWNFVMPYLFALKTISWGQAWCLSFLAGSLIKATQTNNNKS
jgi:hypothetical protein